MPTAWLPLTAADIEARIPANVIAALRERFNLEGSDPLAVLIADVVARIRGAVSSCDQYVLDADTTTIPPELRDDAAWLVVTGLMLRVPDVMPMTDSHTARILLAEDRLKSVAKCDLAVSTPVTPETSSTVQSTGGVTLVTSRPRLNTRDRLSGLL